MKSFGRGNLIPFGKRLSRYIYYVCVVLCRKRLTPLPKLLKGQKLKSLVMELKAHEKLVLTMKKKRHTLDQEIDKESPDGSSAMTRLQEKNRREAEDELDLERDLEKILSQYHLNPGSILYSESKIDKKNVKFDDGHANHINSVLPSSKEKDVNSRKFDEPQVESLYLQGKELASLVYDAAVSESSESEGRRRKKSMEEWFLALERDLDVMEGRVKKSRFLQQELDRYKVKAKKIENKYLEDQENQESNHVNAFIEGDENLRDDIKQRLKSLKHKIKKSEKEIGDRIIQRKREEFPTSRSEGDL